MGAAVVNPPENPPAAVKLRPMTQKEFTKVVDVTMKFIVAFGGLPLYTYQYVFARRIVESVLNGDGATITGLWSRQTGKTTTVAITGIGLAVVLPSLARQMPHLAELHTFKNGFFVGIFAPVTRQANLSYSRMRKIVHSALGQEILQDPDIDVVIDSSRSDALSMNNGSYVHAKTASPDSNIEGETYHLVITDESQKLDRFKVEKEIEPMLSSTNGTMVKIGTAWLSRGGFHSDIHWNIETYERGKRDKQPVPRNHFEFPYEVVVAEKRAAYERDGNKFHLNYEKYVQRYIAKRGKNSLAFRMNFMLKWQESNIDVFSAAALLDAQNTSRHLNRYLGTELTRVAGIDVGKENDPTVVTINEVDFEHPIELHDPVTGEKINFYRKEFVAIKEFEGRFEDIRGIEGQYAGIVNFLREWDVVKVTIDATGMGDPVFERLQTLTPEILWDPFKFSTPTKHNLYKTYIDEIESGRQKIAASKESQEDMHFKKWLEEHRSLEKHTTANKYIDCRAPEPDSKSSQVGDGEESEFHDDYPDSSALACWAAKEAADADVEVVDSGRGAAHTGGRSSIRSRYARRW